MEPPLANAVLTVFRAKLRGELDVERLLDGPMMVDDEDGATIISTADPDAEAKLSAHPAVVGVEKIGRAALVGDWIAR